MKFQNFLYPESQSIFLRNFVTLLCFKSSLLGFFPPFNSTCSSKNGLIKAAPSFEGVNLDYLLHWEHIVRIAKDSQRG